MNDIYLNVLLRGERLGEKEKEKEREREGSKK